MNLELMALRWLLYEKRCELALRERSPRSVLCGQPDALGITKARYLIEIEIKRSMSDFRADAKKPSRWFRLPENPNRYRLLAMLPKQFYYLTPAELTDAVVPICPDWAGLMRGPTKDCYGITVVNPAPVNQASRRLSVKECCRLLRMTANWAMTEAETLQSQVLRFRDGNWAWPEPDFEI